ncbi:MAG: DUF3991 and TOPRIM domain-containing protein [Lawsonibacter sp.]
MPVSQRGKLYFTDIQFTMARDASALEYAKTQHYDLVRDGRTYYLREHDSMIFTPDGRWFWNSRQLAGRALELLQHYEGLSLPEAVLRLTEERSTPPSAYLPPGGSSDQPKKPFQLPDKADSMKRLFAYLCGTRGLDGQIISQLIKEDRLYESATELKSQRTGKSWVAHNAVFIGLDETGKARSAFMRGMTTYGKPFKHDVESSAVEFAFCLPGLIGVDTVAVFEGAIDAISHATLIKRSGADYRTMDRIALDCTWAEPLLVYLRSHPNIREIRLCLDNDAAGSAGMDTIRSELVKNGYTPERGYQVMDELPPAKKDWNDFLLLQRQIEARQDAGYR